MTTSTAPATPDVQRDPAAPTTRRGGRRRPLRALGTHTVLILVAAVFAVPVLALLSTALKTQAQNTASPPEWIPDPLVWTNFPAAMAIAPFASMLANTVTIVGLQVIGVTFSSALIGYGFGAAAVAGPECDVSWS